MNVNNSSDKPTAPAGGAARASWAFREVEEILREWPEHRRQAEAAGGRLAELLVVSEEEAAEAGALFNRLRWGGLAVVVAPRREEAAGAAARLGEAGFAIEAGPACLRGRMLGGLAIPLLSRKAYYVIARKTRQVLPGEVTPRFTYDVRLVRSHESGALVVLKEVPSLESVIQRLRGKFPETPVHVIERRARKFTQKIFPMFLGREEAILRDLERTLPEAYARRVPRVIHAEHDKPGSVRRLWMTWLRNGRPSLSHIDFAYQSADLLRALHDVGRVIHLDLRLDNVVVTKEGVGFVDFGSAVRDDEDLARNPMLSSLFEELMQTSQIQRMLTQMTRAGDVTSEVIRQSHHKVDKAVDFFYLAVHFNNPHANPDLVDLIRYEPGSGEARALSKLTGEILRPKDPANPAYRSARDIVQGIERIRAELESGAAGSTRRGERSTIQ